MENRQYLTYDEVMLLPPGDFFTLDTEIYPNYFLLAFKHIESGKYILFESFEGELFYGHREQILWMLWRFCTVGFNSLNFDLPMIFLAITEKSNEDLSIAAHQIIEGGLRSWQFEKQYNITIPKLNHIDVMDVCPLKGGLKLYAGRLHANCMQDLPYDPSEYLTVEQAAQVAGYCCNDLDNTELIFKSLYEEVIIRQGLSNAINEDLRSKSRQKVAERYTIKKLGRFVSKRTIPPNFTFNYFPPNYIKFRLPQLQSLLEYIVKVKFYITSKNKISMGEKVKVTVGNTVYTIGVGGMHSNEKHISHYSDDNYVIIDRDVASFYPMIILNNKLYPSHIGPEVLEDYKEVVNSRLAAKKSGDFHKAEALKIVINSGLFGKSGDRFSPLYSPDNVLIQVTMTGQLSLLMLAEMIEQDGISVISGNTDGLVIKCPRNRIDELNNIIGEWEQLTGFQTEETIYKSLHSRDVNNYIAIKEDGAVKGKGCYLDAWRDKKLAIFRFHKNPETTICIEAVENFLRDGKSIEKTITEDRDIRKFIVVRQVNGGAMHKGELLGKVIRWYYGKQVFDPLIYKTSGNKVPKSEGAIPCMELPDELPSNIDYNYYIEKSKEMLKDLGYGAKTQKGLL